MSGGGVIRAACPIARMDAISWSIRGPGAPLVELAVAAGSDSTAPPALTSATGITVGAQVRVRDKLGREVAICERITDGATRGNYLVGSPAFGACHQS